MISTNTRDILITIGVPLFAAAIAAFIALRRPKQAKAGTIAFAGTWILSIIFAFVVGLVLDSRYAETTAAVDIPAAMILPVVEFFVGALVASVAAIVVAVVADSRSE